MIRSPVQQVASRTIVAVEGVGLCQRACKIFFTCLFDVWDDCGTRDHGVWYSPKLRK
jgi:hypothetical protein